MFKESESVTYRLEEHEQFLATKGRDERAETFRVETLSRWVNHKSTRPLLSAQGPRILKNGDIGTRITGGSFGRRYTSCDVPLPDKLRAELEKTGFFDGMETDA